MSQAFNITAERMLGSIPETILDAAIDWMVLLRSGEAGDREHADFASWLAADVQHQRAWQGISGAVDRSVHPIRAAEQRQPGQTRAAEQALLRPKLSISRRKLLRGALAFAGAGVVTHLLISRHGPFPSLTADLSTMTGERKSFALQDGSHVLLNARSAVDVLFDDAERIVRLREGELIVSVAADAQRPFVVQTRHGRVRALGTKFLVRQENDRSFVLVLEHSVSVQSELGHERTLRAGEAAWFNGIQVGMRQSDLHNKAAWQKGMLSANDEPLGDLIRAIRPYRSGLIRVSPDAAKLRVLGAFPLDDTDRLLESLEQTLPIRVTHYSPWLVMIDIRS